MILIVVFLVLLLLFFWPIIIEVNSDSGIASMRVFQVVFFELSFNNFRPVYRVKILGITTRWIDFKINTVHDTFKNRTQKRSINGWVKVIRTFRIMDLYIRLNTGKVQLNGVLFPVFYFINVYFKKNISINFNGVNSVHIVAKNNLARLSWAFISST